MELLGGEGVGWLAGKRQTHVGKGVLFWLLLQRPLGKQGLPDSAARAINHHKSNPPPRRDLEVTPELHTFTNTERTH